MDLSQIGKWIIYIGALFVIIGTLTYIASKMGLHVGKLPGDIIFSKASTTFYFPITTCIFLSILVSFIITLVQWLTKK